MKNSKRDKNETYCLPVLHLVISKFANENARSFFFGGVYSEKPFFSFVGEKCCNTTILDPQQLKTVGVGLTFQSFVGDTFISFIGPTIFVSQQMKSVGVGGNHTPFVVASLLFLQIFAMKSV